MMNFDEFNQYIALDADFIFFARYMYEQHHLSSSINFAMQKIMPDTVTALTVKKYFKGSVVNFVRNDNAFPFISLVKETTLY